MPSIYSKISELLLKRIRDKQAIRSENGAEPGSRQTALAQAPVKIREASFADFLQVSSLTSRLGQGPDTIENWARLWKGNPAVESGQKTTIGWILQAGEQVVGFLGSIPLLYAHRGRTLRAATTCRLAIDPAYRPYTHLLITSFFRQKELDLLLNTTATQAAGKMMLAVKASQLPQQDYGEVLFWILNPFAFSRATLARLGISNGLIGLASGVAGTALYGIKAIRAWNYRAKLNRCEIKKIPWDSGREELEAFWVSQEQERPALMGKRTPSIMKWHFEPPQNRRPSELLACYFGGVLKGYVVVRHDGKMKNGLRGTSIVDLMADQDNSEILRTLLAASYQRAIAEKSDLLEVMGFPSNIRRVFKEARPFHRQYPACPFFFKTFDKSLGQELASADAWYACPFDGDSSLWP